MEEMQKIVNYKSNTLKKGIIFAFVVLLFVIGVYFFFFDNEKEANYHYVTEAATKGELTLTVSTTGYIQPVESIDVGTEVSGTIENVYVDYNDIVKKGQLLAVLDKTKYQSAFNKAKASLAAADASVQSAEAQFFQADKTLKRDEALKASTKGALPSSNDYDRDYSNYLAAKAQVANAEALAMQAKNSVDSAQYDLEKTHIYSPVDGIILVRSIDAGQTVAASFQTPILFKIAKDLTKMELQASIDEADVAKIKSGQKVTFGVDAYPEKIFEASIHQVYINSEILEGVVTYLAIINVDNTDLLLRPGMSANASIITKTVKDAYIISRSALLYIPVHPTKKTFFSAREKKDIAIDAKPHIWILRDDKPQKVYVDVLGSNGPMSAVMSSELKSNDDIIISQEKES
ncbi:MAG: efflux RND transporter periplasmic adaptor subunit [Sulfurovum sp.]|nr:efflux RND transporter periplasmic adaptor subunit [Sulfurovum sp.]